MVSLEGQTLVLATLLKPWIPGIFRSHQAANPFSVELGLCLEVGRVLAAGMQNAGTCAVRGCSKLPHAILPGTRIRYGDSHKPPQSGKASKIISLIKHSTTQPKPSGKGSNATAQKPSLLRHQRQNYYSGKPSSTVDSCSSYGKTTSHIASRGKDT